MVKDVLLRLTLSISNLREHTYDAAVNMSGKVNGCQEIINHDHPNALRVHCAAHCFNLVTEATAESCALLRDVLANANDLGVLYERSGKYKQIFDIANA